MSRLAYCRASHEHTPCHRRAAGYSGFQRDAQGKPLIGLDDASLFAYGQLLRLTETLILDLFGRGLLSGTTHTCLGQELCQMAVVRALHDPEDVVLSNHRNHGHFMTYSGHFTGLVAEIMGREAGVCRGYGGSQHLAFRHFHSNGVQAGMTALGTGLALDRRQRGSRGDRRHDDRRRHAGRGHAVREHEPGGDLEGAGCCSSSSTTASRRPR